MNDLSGNIVRTDTATMNVESAQSDAIERIRARYIVARSQPRNWKRVAATVLSHCERVRFAERARFTLPRWDSKKKKHVEITGFSIRFAEQALLAMGNSMPETVITSDDSEKLVVEQVLTDLEANVTFKQQFVIRKLQERRYLRDGQEAVSKRQNSTGETVYQVRTSDQDLRMIVNAQVSLAMRNQVLRLVPADILEDAEDAINATLDAHYRSEAGRTKLIASYSKLGVLATQLEDFVGRKLEEATAQELRLLIQVGTAISEGHTSWDRVMADNSKAASEPKAVGIKERLRGQTNGSKPEPKKRRGRPPKQTSTPTTTTPSPEPTPEELQAAAYPNAPVAAPAPQVTQPSPPPQEQQQASFYDHPDPEAAIASAFGPEPPPTDMEPPMREPGEEG